MPTAMSMPKHQFSFEHWSKAASEGVSVRSADGISTDFMGKSKAYEAM